MIAFIFIFFIIFLLFVIFIQLKTLTNKSSNINNKNIINDAYNFYEDIAKDETKENEKLLHDTTKNLNNNDINYDSNFQSKKIKSNKTICKNCGSEIDFTNYCPHCGKKQ